MSSEETEKGKRTASSSQTDRRSTGPSLAPTDSSVRTIQLYPADKEARLPVTSLQNRPPLTLEFDLMERQGRALSVYFQHADRTWRRDLSPSRVLETYQDDNLVDYQSSQGTTVPYVHYTYRFPNDDIQFRVSGNYILRVTEKGQRDSVLFERPFFVTEETGQLRQGTESFVVTGQQQRSIRPVAQYDPPAALQGDPFGYTVCFAQNGRLPDARCQDRPLLVEQPQLKFELDRAQAFAPSLSSYGVDLGNLSAGADIERIDRTATPWGVRLEPDYANFSESSFGDDLNGQIVVREAVRNRANPSVTAEYVRTTFSFVPPNDQPLSGELVVAGSFSGMDPRQGETMDWVASRSRYEGTVLLKQGRYQYFYQAASPSAQSSLDRLQAPRRTNTYTTFVYYEDPSQNTDRLLRVGQFEK